MASTNESKLAAFGLPCQGEVGKSDDRHSVGDRHTSGMVASQITFVLENAFIRCGRFAYGAAAFCPGFLSLDCNGP